jgi:O-antigen/teichoic acid export membrane protein
MPEATVARSGAAQALGIVALARRSVVYALGGLAYKGVALLTVPVLARLLVPAELGLLDLAAVIASIVGILVVLGTDQGIAYLEPRTGSHESLWSSALCVSGVVGIAAILLAVPLSSPLSRILTGGEDAAGVFMAAVVYGTALALATTAFNGVRLHSRPGVYAAASFLIVSAEMGFALVIAWQFESPVTLMVLGWAAGSTLIALPLLLAFVPSLGMPRLATMRRLVGYGAPLVPAAVLWLIGDAWIRSSLAHGRELATLGEYGIAYRIASVLGLVVTGFGVAWHPYLYRSPEGTASSRAANAIVYVLLALGLIGVVLTALAPEAVAVIAGREYAGARVAVAPLVAAMVALGVFVLVSAVAGASGSTRRVAVAASIGMACQIVAAGPLVSALHLVGGALASLSGYVVAALFLLGMEWQLLRGATGKALVIVATIVVAGLVVANGVAEAALAIRILVVGGFAAVATAAAYATRTTLRPRSTSA